MMPTTQIEEVLLDNVHVEVHSAPAGFCACFQRVWQTIPAHDRQRIVEYWTKPRQNGAPVTQVKVYVEESMTGKEGDVRNLGKHLYFLREKVSQFDAYADNLLSHELAHVYRWAMGDINDDDRNHPERIVPMERDAVETAANWGFPLPGNRSPADHYRRSAEVPLKILREVFCLPDSDPRIEELLRFVHSK
jgi:hypothetical protein